jgi:hydrogenase expression/formation protein HypE
MEQERILLDHGSGGRLTSELIAEMMLPAFHNPILSRMEDGACVDLGGGRIAFSTDSYVVDPIFFPGGNIGDLAVNGTVNDVAMCGARPIYLSAGLIIEAGFPVRDLKAIIEAMGRAAEAAGVQIVTGDTKVVAQGSMDKIFINTAGVGLIPDGLQVSASSVRPGDKVILSGAIAEHGMAVLTQREGLSFSSAIASDSAPLNHMVERMLRTGRNIRALRDPTRGGVGTALNEIARQSGVGVRIAEERIPVKENVAALCELLGFDPLYVANEGKLLAFVNSRDAESVLSAMREDSFGADAEIIGEAVSDHRGRVVMETAIGGERIVDIMTGEQLPRIC